MTLFRRLFAAFAAAGALLVIGAVPASAHVTVDSADPVGDGSVVMTFSFNHACAEAGTTSLTMEIPSGSTALAATAPPGWTGVVAESTVEWSGPEIDSGQVVSFTVHARLSGSIGQPIIFPTVQGCRDGDGFAWIDVDESADAPAPRLIATAAVLDAALTVTPGQAGSVGEVAGPMAISMAIAIFAVMAAAAASVIGGSRP